LAIPLVVNGQTFEYPVNFDEGWGVAATGWAQAVTNGLLQRSGGNFPLTADVNFGPNFGLLSAYFTSRVTNPASTGLIRLAKTDTIDWRNNANAADNILAVNSSDQLTYNGVVIGAGTGVTSITGTANQIIASASTGNITLSTPQSIAAGSSPTFVGLTLTGLTASTVLTTNGSDVLTSSATTATELGFVHGVTSAIQTQVNSKLSLTGGTMSGNIAMGSNSITGVANGSSAQDAVAFGQLATLIPSGSVIMYAGVSSPPAGWLLCDGTLYTTASFPALFAAIGYTFGGSGANFNVPNMTNRVPVGPGSLAALGVSTGSTTHTLTVSEIPAGLTVTDPGHFHTYSNDVSAGADSNTISAPRGSFVRAFSPITDTATTGISVGGGGSAMSLIQPSLGMGFIIKT
jgi:microcystin-dependent protein